VETSKTKQRFFKTRDLTLTAALAAVFVISTFYPVTAYIGGAGFITLEIIVVPLIAALLRPVHASIAIVFGSIGAALFETGLFPKFGFFGLLVPVIATILGSVAFHSRLGAVLPWSYVLAGAIYYIVYSKGGTLFWLIPYTIVIVSLPVALTTSGTRWITLLSFYTAMSWQVSLNILSISLGGLVDGVWSLITPFMLLERTIATVGSSGVIVALKSRLDTRLELSQELARR
jgi:hypothetical protein